MSSKPKSKSGAAKRGGAVLPPQLAAFMWPEVPSLTEEIIDAIREEVPGYERPLTGHYGEALRTGVEQAVTAFISMVADPLAPRPELEAVCRRLGSMEARGGRSLDSLQAAYRVGSQVAWARVARGGKQLGLSSDVMADFAMIMFEYIGELVELSVAGYRDTESRSGQLRRKRRRKLLALLLETPPASARSISALAAQAGWTLPTHITPVAVQQVTPHKATDADETNLDPDVLADLAAERPCLLIPGPFSPERRSTIETALAGRGLAVGLTVPLGEAADSLRWARRALELVDAGTIVSEGMVFCADHLVTLLLLSDGALAEHVARRTLSGLDGMTTTQRTRLTETFSTWLDTHGSVPELAERLRIHQQTVRYRLRKVREVFGPLAEPDERFTTQVALRISRLLDKAGSFEPEDAGQSPPP
jgi:hypothetical protein